MKHYVSKHARRSRCAFEVPIDISTFGKVTAKQRNGILDEFQRVIHACQDAHCVVQRFVVTDNAIQVDADLVRARGKQPRVVLRFPLSQSQATRLSGKIDGFVVADKPVG